MTELCCGLDIGSTNLKAVFADATGRVLWARSVATPRIDDGVGPATSASELLHAAEELIVAGWREVGTGSPLRAISSAGVGEDGSALGANLEPIGASIPWFAERAIAEAEELAGCEAATPRLGIRVDRFRTVAKWLWTSRHRLEELAAAAVWAALTDYPAIVWSGRPFLSETLAARTAAYDVYARRWHEPMLRAANAPALPGVVVAGTVLGAMRPGRLRQSGAADAGTLVVAGGHDHPVAASYIRRFEPGAIVDSMGTAEVVYGETDAVGVRPLDPRMAYSVPVLGGAGLSCLGVFELAAALAPYRKGIHGDLVSAVLSGETSSNDVGQARQRSAAHDTVSPSAVDRDTALAAAEHAIHEANLRGAALIEAMDAGRDIYTTGGWSRSDRFLQMRADLFGRDIVRFEEDELTGAGAALIAWAAGAASDMPDLVRPRVRRFEPHHEKRHAHVPVARTHQEESGWPS